MKDFQGGVMKIKEKQWSGLCDRSCWHIGPWDAEPDKVQWQDEATGLACLVVRGTMGAWCGYVGLPPGHPWYGGNVHHGVVEVHGGITYGPSPCGKNICHEVDGVDDVRWVGFDCGHHCDLSPEDRPSRNAVYRDLAFVQREVTMLAAQLAEVR